MFSIFGKRSKQDNAVPGPAADAPSATAHDATAVTPSPALSDGPDPATYGLNVAALTEPAVSPEPAPAFGPVDVDRTDALKPAIVDAISTVFDPEIPVNIYELGLIYEIAADVESRVHVRMTLTSPACPSAQQLPSEVRYKVKAVPGVADCSVDVVWEPPWTKDMMSETAKLSLGMF
jgi:FeS assembly SUF system protein